MKKGCCPIVYIANTVLYALMPSEYVLYPHTLLGGVQHCFEEVGTNYLTLVVGQHIIEYHGNVNT